MEDFKGYSRDERRKMVRNVNRSFEKDRERWVDSYTNHTATALRQNVVKQLAATNGHSSTN